MRQISDPHTVSNLRVLGGLLDLIANRNRIDQLAAALVEHEPLDEVDAYRLGGVDRDSELRAKRPAGVSSVLSDPDATRHVPGRRDGA